MITLLNCFILFLFNSNHEIKATTEEDLLSPEDFVSIDSL